MLYTKDFVQCTSNRSVGCTVYFVLATVQIIPG